MQGDARLPETDAGWEKVLSEEADGYAVIISVSSD